MKSMIYRRWVESSGVVDSFNTRVVEFNNEDTGNFLEIYCEDRFVRVTTPDTTDYIPYSQVLRIWNDE